MIALSGLALTGVGVAFVATEAELVQPPLLDILCAMRLCSDGSIEKRAEASQEPGEQARLYEFLVRRDPAAASRWCDLGQSLLALKRNEEAQNAFQRAHDLAPHVPAVLMRVANAQFQLGKPQAAVPYMKAVLDSVRDYDNAIFSSYDRIGLNADEVLRSGLPDSAQPSYLRYLMEANQTAGANIVWKRIVQRGSVAQQVAASYTNYLLAQGEVEMAARAWAAATPDSFKAGSELYNGSFETEFSGSMLDWIIRPVDGATISRDTTLAAAGSTSLRISFDGTRNVDFAHATQMVWLKAGSYRLRGTIHTSEVTTDQGVGLRIFDPKHPAGLDAWTLAVAGSEGWKRVECQFQVPAGNPPLAIQVVRRASERIENKIRGTVWVDDLRITPAQ
ncbi:MAG: tetratricopeptide repeat protein [Bryobacteraceae bacterium]